MKKTLTSILCATLLLATVGCSTTAAVTSSATSASATETSVSSGEITRTTNTSITATTDSSWSEEDAKAVITLLDSGSMVNGEGAGVSGSTVTITKGGLYILSGTLSSGEVIVEAPSNEQVHIVLNGVNITAGNNAAIYEKQSDGLTVTVAENTENTLIDATAFTYTDVENEEPKATLFAKDDLTINGTGSLTINANSYQGATTKDDLILESVNLTVDSEGDSVRGRDSITVLSGAYTLTSNSDAMQSNNDTDASKGTITIEDGTFTVVAANDGIQAETNLIIHGGNFNITTAGGYDATASTTDMSSKGLKATTMMTISDGTFVLNTLDDAIHSNGNIEINGGEYTIQTGDDGIHADGDLAYNNGTLAINNCYEGMESATMTINDGTIYISSTDDGINLSSSDDTAIENRPGVANNDLWLIINGGTITIEAGSDAIDSNGNATMNGGTVNLTAALLGEGETVDVDGTWTQNGGDLTETGGNGPGDGMGGGRGGR